jgi:hypothetical protein
VYDSSPVSYRVIKFTETGRRMVVTSGWGESEWGLVFNGCRVSVGVDKRIPDVNGGDSRTMRMYSML